MRRDDKLEDRENPAIIIIVAILTIVVAAVVYTAIWALM